MTASEIDALWGLIQAILFVSGGVWMFMNFFMLANLDVWEIESILAVNAIYVLGMLLCYGMFYWAFL